MSSLLQISIQYLLEFKMTLYSLLTKGSKCVRSKNQSALSMSINYTMVIPQVHDICLCLFHSQMHIQVFKITKKLRNQVKELFKYGVKKVKFLPDDCVVSICVSFRISSDMYQQIILFKYVGAEPRRPQLLHTFIVLLDFWEYAMQ